MAKLVKREAILFKLNPGAYGTDAAPTAAANAVLVEDIGWSYAGARLAERNAIKPTLGAFQGIFAGTLMEMTFTVEVKGSGAAGTPPEFGALLRACGLDETVTASTSVAYAPVSDGHEEGTLYYYEDGSLYKLTGCRGTVSLAANVGEVAKLSFTMTGHVADPSDAALPAATYINTTPPPVIGAAFSVGGYAAVVSALSLDVGNTIATPPSMSAADGYGQVLITDRAVTGSFDPEATTVAVQDWVGDWQDGTTKAITTGVIGSAAGNRFALSIPQAWYSELSPGDRDGVRTREIGFGAAGDDAAFTLTFT